MKLDRLADTEEIRKIESRFTNLISRTFLKGAVGVPASQIQGSVKKSFSSKTYETQLDKIIDDIYIASVDYADRKTEELGGTSSGSAQASKPAACSKVPAANLQQSSCSMQQTCSKVPAATRLTAAKDKPLPVTEEAIKQTKALTGDAAESVTRWLKDNDLYIQHPDQLARQVRDLWDGQKYKARRFAVTFTADLAENTAIHRYNDLGITYLQFFAEIDEKTTPQCRAFHGTIIKTDTRDIEKYRPPLHHHCRSALIPATSKVLKDNQDLLIENRDFTKQLNQDFKPFPGRVDSDEIKGVFEEIGKFNDKYRIDQFILDEDLQLRLMKLKLDIYTEIPGKGKTKLDDFLKPEKVEPPKPKYLTGQEIREKIPQAKEAYSKQLLEANRKQIKARIAKDEVFNEYDIAFSKGADQKTLDEIYARMDIASQKWYEALTEYQDLRGNEVKSIRELLYINDGTPKPQFLKLDPDATKTVQRQKTIDEALDFLNKAANQKIRDNLPDIQLYEIGPGRAYTIRGENAIWIGSGEGTDSLLHEIGHNIEYNNPKVLKSAKNHYKARTKGEKVESLRSVTGNEDYADHEMTKKDKFITPYAGKVTSETSTEITSIALEYLYRDPENLATKDPELFDWIVNTLRGKYD